MTLTFQLDKNDYLQHLLFSASKSKRVKAARLRSWLVLSGVLLILSVAFFQSHNNFLGYYCLGTGITALMFYPFYLRWYYKNHYKKVLKDKNGSLEAITVIFSESTIELFNSTTSSKVNLSEVEKVSETGQYFYVKIKADSVLIIPKTKIDNVDSVRSELKQITEKLKAEYHSELDWRWK